MPVPAIPSPRRGTELIDAYFIENRTRLLDIAAFLDRLDRAEDPATRSDFRARAFREALSALCSEEGGRTERVQMIFSDPTSEPRPELDQKGAQGAYDRWRREG